MSFRAGKQRVPTAVRVQLGCVDGSRNPGATAHRVLAYGVPDRHDVLVSAAVIDTEHARRCVGRLEARPGHRLVVPDGSYSAEAVAWLRDWATRHMMLFTWRSEIHPNAWPQADGTP